jgi:alkaline phosphatase
MLKLHFNRIGLTLGLGCLLAVDLFGQAANPSLSILLPERTRLLQGQYVDIILEVRNASAITGLRVTAGTTDITSRFAAPAAAQLDCDASQDLVVRANLQSFDTPGTIRLTATATANGREISDTREIVVRPFTLTNRRNIVLFIGDAMGTAYRDAARLVSKAIIGSDNRNSFREGFFDDLLEMDKMPASGMSMTYGTDSIVPDSANTGTAWAAGNKSFLNAVNVFTDGTDCRWRFNNAANAANLQFITDNPRVENLWQYLKRRHGYRTGIVSTADVTDATPAVQGAYSGFRQTRGVISLHYFENPMLNGQPAFDVIMGGGIDQFTSAGRADRRDLLGEFQARGFRYITSAAELRALTPGQPVLGLFKGNANPAVNAAGIAATDSNMDVAYDKLRLQRPASEPNPNFGRFTDQPMLELMTEKAIEVLSSSITQAPFILMVEAASIDKQSHPNHATGTIWDTIEMDRAVGVARRFAARRNDTLIVVTADHDQSMHIIGVANTPDAEYYNRERSQEVVYTTPRGEQAFTVWGDSYTNARAGLPFINGSVGANNNRGAGGMPGTYAATGSTADPAAATYSTYFGVPAYRLDSASGYPANTNTSAAPIRRLSIGFRTGDHTGSSVPVTAEGPGALLFTGYMDQTDIMFKMAAALSTDTTEIDRIVRDLQTNTAYPRTVGR